MSRNETTAQPPTIDDRTPSELRAELTTLAEQYVDDWNAESEDMATELLTVGSEFGHEVIRRLNRLPAKHRAGFLETLGKQPQPPQPARLPLLVEPASDLERNVEIPSGTQVTAATPDGGTTVFEIPPGSGFEATPASLVAVYAVEPELDRLTSHGPLATGDRQQLFDGENLQQHALYLGDESLFEVDCGAVFELEIEGHLAEEFDKSVVWEYYGTKPDSSETERDTEAAGWHRLSPLETDRTSLRSRLEALSNGDDQAEYTTRRVVPGEFVETSIDCIESRWIRCRVTDPTAACFESRIERLSITAHPPDDRPQALPDAAFADDVPLAVEAAGDIEPLGQFPQPSSRLYLASDEALSKPGTAVRVSFEPPAEPHEPTEKTADSLTAEFGALEEPPVVSWEYWNGSGWVGLAVEDGTANLQKPGEVTFVVPDDLEATAVAGQQAYWIRGRLVAGSYGALGAALTADSDTGVDRPRFSSITVSYEHTASEASQQVLENNGQFERWSADDCRPFRPLATDSQTVYFGFDGPLEEGPIPIFVPLEQTDTSRGFDPGVRWEYCSEPQTDSWSQLTVTDGTNGLTERGVVSLQCREPTQSIERFGTACHWIRAVITGDQFAPPTGQSNTAGEQPTAETAESRSTDDHSIESITQPPTLEGLYPNTQWADNARTVENELLGSSDGSANQQFACAHEPLLECELWVDESNALSRADQAELQATDPDRIEVITDDRGEPTAVWVRWQAVDRLKAGDSRVYRLDKTDGTIQFGDGDCGKIPPQGIDSIRATYRTGGGPAGNIPPRAVEALKTPISLVKSVENPFGGAGGTPIEPTAALVERAAGEIRSRGRAVTPQEYEAIAASAVRSLGRITCQPNRGPTGDRKPGWVRVVVVPEGACERPAPSLAVKTRLEEALCEAAPTHITRGSRSKLSVSGPTYIPCDIEATLEINHGESRSRLTTEIQQLLSAFLHPIDGKAGEGWAFGEAPRTDAICQRLQQIPAVADVRALSVSLRVDGERQRLGERPQPPTLPADGLLCNGSHRLTLEVENEP